MKIYVLVRFSYDWYEFQDFYIATTKLEKIHQEVKKRKMEILPLLFYDNKKDVKEMSNLKGLESTHLRVFIEEDE